MEIIVLTNDRPDLTTITLQSLAVQTVPENSKKRLIVVDDGKTSAMSSPCFRKMVDFCAHFGWKVEYHRNMEHKGVTYVRHVASKLASEDAFFMIDGDVLIPQTDTLARMYDALNMQCVSTAFVVPRLLNIDNEHGAWYDPLAKTDSTASPENLQWHNPSFEPAGVVNLRHGATACIAYNRSKFEKAGGFSFWETVNEGEEVLMSNKLHNAGLLIPRLVVYHFGNQWTKEGLMTRLDDTKRKLVNQIHPESQRLLYPEVSYEDS